MKRYDKNNSEGINGQSIKIAKKLTQQPIIQKHSILPRMRHRYAPHFALILMRVNRTHFRRFPFSIEIAD